MQIKQHVTQPTHNRGHTQDLVITYGLFTGVSSVVDRAVSDHYCVFFNITSFIQQEALVVDFNIYEALFLPEETLKSFDAKMLG